MGDTYTEAILEASMSRVTGYSLVPRGSRTLIWSRAMVAAVPFTLRGGHIGAGLDLVDDQFYSVSVGGIAILRANIDGANLRFCITFFFDIVAGQLNILVRNSSTIVLYYIKLVVPTVNTEQGFLGNS